MEWIIIDDGTDKIEDLVVDIPEVKYFKYEERMTLGKKRNLMHEKAIGEFIVYMDDDDYYPPERVAHAVEMLQLNPDKLVAGSSEMHIYFKHIDQMYQFGPYGPNHSTAASFAFRREYLNQATYDNEAALAEERTFLKNYTTPLVQLDTTKTILVFSHIHNSFDKKVLLKELPNPYVKQSERTISDFVKEPEMVLFFKDRIDTLLECYEPGRPENKPEVLKQIAAITERREQLKHTVLAQQNRVPITPEIIRQLQQQGASPEVIHQFILQGGVPIGPAQNALTPEPVCKRDDLIQSLMKENAELREKNQFLEQKISLLIKRQIAEKKAAAAAAVAVAEAPAGGPDQNYLKKLI
jgi:hypothetical protein